MWEVRNVEKWRNGEMETMETAETTEMDNG